MKEPVAAVGVTGATGRLGSRVAQRLATMGFRQRLLARAPRLPGADAVRASYTEPDAVRVALRGVPVVSASGSRTRVAQHRTFAEAVAAALNFR